MAADFPTFLATHQQLTILAITLLAALSVLEFVRARRETGALSPTDVVYKINHEFGTVIDLRNETTFKQSHIIDAQNIIPSVLMSNSKRLAKYKTKPCILVCATGAESQKSAAQLRKSGYNAFALAGGMRAWQAASMPTVKDE